MKKTISILTMMFFLCGTLSMSAAEADNSVYAGNIQAKQGETVEMPVYLNNTIGMCSVQFDITLPEGFSIDYTTNRAGTKVYTVTLDANRFEDLDHTVSVTQQTDGSYRFVINSNTNALTWDEDAQQQDIRKTSPIVNVSVKVAENATAGSHTVNVDNVTMATYSSAEKKITKYVGTGKTSTITVIGSEPTVCATPSISFSDGRLLFSCETAGAEYHYTLSSPDISSTEQTSTGEVAPSGGITVSVYATAEGHTQSATATKTIPYCLGIQGDFNGDGKITAEDVAREVDKALQEK